MEPLSIYLIISVAILILIYLTRQANTLRIALFSLFLALCALNMLHHTNIAAKQLEKPSFHINRARVSGAGSIFVGEPVYQRVCLSADTTVAYRTENQRRIEWLCELNYSAFPGSAYVSAKPLPTGWALWVQPRNSSHSLLANGIEVFSNDVIQFSINDSVYSVRIEPEYSGVFSFFGSHRLILGDSSIVLGRSQNWLNIASVFERWTGLASDISLPKIRLSRRYGRLLLLPQDGIWTGYYRILRDGTTLAVPSEIEVKDGGSILWGQLNSRRQISISFHSGSLEFSISGIKGIPLIGDSEELESNRFLVSNRLGGGSDELLLLDAVCPSSDFVGHLCFENTANYENGFVWIRDTIRISHPYNTQFDLFSTELGDGSGNLALSARISRLLPTHLNSLRLFLLLSSLTPLLFVLQLRYGRSQTNLLDSKTATCLFGIVWLLLVIRMILGMRVALNPPFESRGLLLAADLLLLMPLAIHYLLSNPRRSDFRHNVIVEHLVNIWHRLTPLSFMIHLAIVILTFLAFRPLSGSEIQYIALIGVMLLVLPLLRFGNRIGEFLLQWISYRNVPESLYSLNKWWFRIVWSNTSLLAILGFLLFLHRAGGRSETIYGYRLSQFIQLLFLLCIIRLSILLWNHSMRLLENGGWKYQFQQLAFYLALPFTLVLCVFLGLVEFLEYAAIIGLMPFVFRLVQIEFYESLLLQRGETNASAPGPQVLSMSSWFYHQISYLLPLLTIAVSWFLFWALVTGDNGIFLFILPAVFLILLVDIIENNNKRITSSNHESFLKALSRPTAYVVAGVATIVISVMIFSSYVQSHPYTASEGLLGKWKLSRLLSLEDMSSIPSRAITQDYASLVTLGYYLQAGIDGGIGYCNAPLRGSLESLSQNDQLYSILLVSEHGIASGIVLFALYIFFLWAASYSLIIRQSSLTDPYHSRFYLASICIISFVVAGIWIILSNIGTLFFVGKSIPLLALNSPMDMVYGMLLVSIVLFTFPFL